MSLDWDTIDEAIVDTLGAAGVTCYPYEGPSLSKVPCATLVPETPEIGYLGADQRYGLGRVTYKLRYYVSLEKDGRQAWADIKTGIGTIVAALGASRDLGGAVRSLELGPGRITPVRTLEGGRRELMCEWSVDVTPKPN